MIPCFCVQSSSDRLLPVIHGYTGKEFRYLRSDSVLYKQASHSCFFLCPYGTVGASLHCLAKIIHTAAFIFCNGFQQQTDGMGILKYQRTVLLVVVIDFLKFCQGLSLRQFSLLFIKIILHVNGDALHLLRRQTCAGFYSLLLQ